MSVLTKGELREELEELEKHRGRHTELITVYVPAGYDVNSVQKQLEAEKSTAKNIKSTATRKNVIDALDKMVRHLKSYKKTPDSELKKLIKFLKTKGKNKEITVINESPYPLEDSIKALSISKKNL